MKPETEVTAADLNALLDGELSAPDAKRVRAVIAAHPHLQQRFAELRRVRNVAHMALRRDRECPPAPAARPRYGLAAAIAAISFAAGIVGGSWLRPPAAANESVQPKTVVAAPSRADSPQTLVHIDNGKHKTVAAGIDRIERLLETHRASGKPLQLEVLMNGGGLVAVRADVSPYATRIARLQRQYPNVTFIACRQTMERFKLEHGAEPSLLPGVTVASSALDQVVHRLEQGWTYIRI